MTNKPTPYGFSAHWVLCDCLGRKGFRLNGHVYGPWVGEKCIECGICPRMFVIDRDYDPWTYLDAVYAMLREFVGYKIARQATALKILELNHPIGSPQNVAAHCKALVLGDRVKPMRRITATMREAKRNDQ